LVELGFWGTVEPGDPADNYRDAKTLHDRVGAKPPGDAFVVSTSASNHSSARRVLILHSERIYSLGAADNYPESVCLGALAFPQFYKSIRSARPIRSGAVTHKRKMSKKATTNKAARRAKGD
jgi:hypothetical protein